LFIFSSSGEISRSDTKLSFLVEVTAVALMAFLIGAATYLNLDSLMNKLSSFSYSYSSLLILTGA
jgi:hypothetical protein